MAGVSQARAKATELALSISLIAIATNVYDKTNLTTRFSKSKAIQILHV